MLHRLLDRVCGADSPAGSDDAPGDRRPMDLVPSLPSLIPGPVETRLPGVPTTAPAFRRPPRPHPRACRNAPAGRPDDRPRLPPPPRIGAEIAQDLLALRGQLVHRH